MKRCLWSSLIVVVAVQAAAIAGLTSVPGLYGTGLDDLGNRLPVNAMDQHYVLTGPGSPAYITPQVMPRLDRTWWPMDNSGPWIGPQFDINQDAPSGNYIYTLTFDLSGLNIADMVLSGQWASDNVGSIWLNGVYTGFTNAGASRPEDTFESIWAFDIHSGFLPQTNTLEFHVNNASGPSGLLVQNLVPEPATLCLLALGGVMLRRRMK